MKRKRKGWPPHVRALGQAAMIKAQCLLLLELKLPAVVHFSARQILELADGMVTELKERGPNENQIGKQ